LKPVSLPTTQLALSAYYILAPAEASSNLAKYDGIRYGQRTSGPDAEGGILYSKTRSEGFGPEVKRRILLGSYTLSSEAMDSYFIKAQKIRRLVQKEFDGVFAAKHALLHTPDSDVYRDEGVDILICPTAASLPPKLSEVDTLDPIGNYVTDVFTVPASLAGLPALSVPLATSPLSQEDGNARKSYNPGNNIGMQIIGQFGMDSTVLEVSQLFEDLGLAKTSPTVSNALDTVKDLARQHDEADRSHSSKWPEDLAKAYVNMSRYYGGGMAAVNYRVIDQKNLPPVSWRHEK
jgi:aspartyl-tRNA(Asn)/glutamyl-tRNA(Gln) amidotransferase subunit A